MSQNRPLRIAAGVLGTPALLYGLVTAGLYTAMRQPPEAFGSIMRNVPGFAMMILPFRPLWMSARSGNLQTGDPAPDFSLPTLTGDQVVQLSAELRERPVVLVFGSYT